jgi:hypothetical protein
MTFDDEMVTGARDQGQGECFVTAPWSLYKESEKSF